MFEWAANVVIIIAGTIYIAGNWQQLKALFRATNEAIRVTHD